MATSRNGTILVVDDEEIMREILETLLAREGYEVRLASSGEEGLDIMRAWLETSFAGGRHARRVDKIAEMERGAMRARGGA